MTPPPAGRILVVCTRYLGDTILAIPFLRSLRRGFPRARIDVRAEGAARALLADCPHVDGFIDWPSVPTAGPAAALAAFRTRAALVRAQRYDRAYLLKPSLSAALLAAAGGIRHRVGFAAEGRLLLSRAVRVGAGRRQSEAYLDLLRGDGIAVDDSPGAAWVTADATAKVARVVAALPADRPRVFVALRSTDGRRHWPLACWAALATRLVAEHGCAVVLCGAPGDGGTHDDLQRRLPPAVAAHVHDLSARVSLRETAALVRHCDLCIGVDSGLVHLAAWCGVPVAVLYGPTDPDRWTPLGAPAAVIRAPRTRAGAAMAGIGVAEVLERALALLPAAAAGLRSVDLRGGTRAYEVLMGTAAAPGAGADASAASAADVPATNPLAQAH